MSHHCKKVECPSTPIDPEPFPATANAFAITEDRDLISFNTTDPNTILRRIRITCFRCFEAVVGADIRPVNGLIYVVTRNINNNLGRLYTLNPITGQLTLVSCRRFPLEGTDFAVDFNPVVDRLRIISNTGQNLRINPDTGEVVSVDGTENYAVGDLGFGTVPRVVGAAYTNSFAGATTTTLYVIEAARNVLAIQNPPNDGTLNTVGQLGITIDPNPNFNTFDIRGRNDEAFASLALASGGFGFFSINLGTGTASQVGVNLEKGLIALMLL